MESVVTVITITITITTTIIIIITVIYYYPSDIANDHHQAVGRPFILSRCIICAPYKT